MTFTSFNESANETANKEGSNVNGAVAVKVSFGNEIRRATLEGSSYPALCELVAKLFVLEQASIVLKYQDEDGDKITMSSDSELQEALRFHSETKKVVRVFVETKPVNVEVKVEASPEQGFRHCKRDPASRHGPHHHHHGPFQHARFQGPVGPSAPGAPVSPAARYGPAGVVAHGAFSAAPSPNDPVPIPKKDAGEYFRMAQECKALKERKCAMKETLRAMKETASSKEDKKAIKEYKEQMRTEFKDAWKGFKQFQKNADRLMARHVADVTIPDNSELPADTPVTKTWRLRNPGTTEWPAGSQLLFISHRGDSLDGPERVVLEAPVFPQQEVEVSVPFITPTEPGRYVGYYRMATPDGAKFGQRVWVSFLIPAGVTSSTAPSAPDQVAMDQ